MTQKRLRLAAAILLVCAFLAMVGRYWNPYYGFTSLLQLDSSDEAIAIHELRDRPIFFYAGNNGYDADTYVQIAFHPLLGSPELKTAINNVPYRARHILPGWISFLLSGGNPDWIAQVYATLNIGVWCVLAGIVWRLLAVGDWKGWVAWAGFLFSAGALYSVRLALTDLLAVTLLAAAILLAERRRVAGGLALLALAGLARETALLGVVAFWSGPWDQLASWRRNLGRTVLVALPLLVWVGYIRVVAGPAPQGFGNLTLPLSGYMEKWLQTLNDFRSVGPYGWLNTTTLLVVVALTVQAIFVLRRRAPDNPGWRLGVTGVAMMMLFGTAVWEGHPGAAARLLLPLGLAFALLVVRQRAGWAWVLLGSLSVLGGLLAFSNPSHEVREIGAGRQDGVTYIMRLGTDSYPTEHTWKHTWGWCGRTASLSIATWPASAEAKRIRLGLRAASPRVIEITDSLGRRLWQGRVGAVRQEVELSPVPPGPQALRFRSDATLVVEGPGAGARGLGFAIYDPRRE